jgi:hypothetical protein
MNYVAVIHPITKETRTPKKIGARVSIES